MARKDVRTVGVATNGNGEAQGLRKGKGGFHGVATGTYAHTANQEAKQAGEDMRRHFRQVLRMLLEERGMTQSELAHEMGVSLGTIKDKLSGASKIDIGEAAQLAEIFNLRLKSLVDPDVTLREIMTFSRGLEHKGCFSGNTLRSISGQLLSVGLPN